MNDVTKQELMDRRVTIIEETKRLHAEVADQIASSDRMLQNFATRLAANPASAFEWADGPMKDAALKRLLEQFTAHLDDAVAVITVDHEGVDHLPAYAAAILDKAQKTVNQLASAPRCSTSECSNIMSRADLWAWSQLLEPCQSLGRRFSRLALA